MEGAWLAQRSRRMILKVESRSSNRDTESHPMQRRWELQGGRSQGRAMLSTSPPAGPKNHRKASVWPFPLDPDK